MNYRKRCIHVLHYRWPDYWIVRWYRRYRNRRVPRDAERLPGRKVFSEVGLREVVLRCGLVRLGQFDDRRGADGYFVYLGNHLAEFLDHRYRNLRPQGMRNKGGPGLFALRPCPP